MRIKHNLEQQIQARNQSGVSEDALKEFSMMFRHFDKEKTGNFIILLFLGASSSRSAPIRTPILVS